MAQKYGLTDRNKKAIVVSEKKMPQRIIGGITDNGVWRIHSNEDIHRLYNSPNILNHSRAFNGLDMPIVCAWTEHLKWYGNQLVLEVDL